MGGCKDNGTECLGQYDGSIQGHAERHVQAPDTDNDNNKHADIQLCEYGRGKSTERSLSSGTAEATDTDRTDEPMRKKADYIRTYIHLTDDDKEYIRQLPYASDKELAEWIGCSQAAICYHRKRMGHPGIYQMRQNFIATVAGRWKSMKIPERRTICDIVGLNYNTVRIYVNRWLEKNK